MAKTPTVKITFLGDSTSAQKSVKDLAAVTGEAEVKVEGFASAFAKLGIAVGAVALLKQAGEAVVAYNAKMQDSEAIILGVTHSQAALGDAFSFADQQAKAGLSAYSDTVAAIAQLTPVAKRAGLDVTDLYHTVQLLSTLNNGPEGGVTGAVVAINEALNGQYRSLQQRFNLPIDGIRDAVNAGVPALQAIDDALAKEGISMDLVTAKSKTTANQFNILKDNLTRIASDAGKPIFDKITSELELWNKALTSSGMKQFGADLRDMITAITTGHALDDFGVQAEKTFYLIGDAFNNMIKAVSGGHINIDQQLTDMRARILLDEAKVKAAIQQGVAQPVADGLSGAASGSPIAPEKVVGYGQALANTFLKGLSSADFDEVDKLTSLLGDLFKGADGKADADKVARAQVILAQALAEVASQGNVTDDTMRDLSAAFGLQSSDVYTLIAAYGRYQQALSGVALAQIKVQGSQAATSIITAEAAGETKHLQDNLDAATSAAQANADASAAVVEGLQDTLKGVQAEADAASRAGQAQLSGMQADLATLQAAQSAASQQRSNDQALLNAAIAGELEYEEQILDGLTDQQRATAAKWQAEIDGQRRAKEGADQKVTDLSRAAHKEDLDYLTRIDAARSSGNEKQARALERELAQRQKQREGATQLAQAQAAVADDDFNAAQEKVQKEGQAQDVKDAQAEKLAAKRVAEQQADIKNVQDAQKAEQDRYAAQERGIQQEIDKTTAAAKVQADKDKKTIDDAKTILDDRKKYWDQEIAKAGINATQMANQAKSAQNFADDMKTAYDYAEKISKLDFSNITTAAAAAAKLPPPGGPTGVSPDQGEGAGTVVGGGAFAGGATGVGAENWLPNYGPIGWGPAIPNGTPPTGWHVENRPTGTFWVKDGSTLDATGTGIKTSGQNTGPGSTPAPAPAPAPAPTPTPKPAPPGQNTGPGSYPQPGPSPAPPPSTGGPGGLSRVGSPLAGVGRIGGAARTAGFGGEPSLAAFTTGGAQPVGGDGAKEIHIHLHAPNLTSLSDRQKVGDTLNDGWAHAERTWDGLRRGGRVKRDVG